MGGAGSYAAGSGGLSGAQRGAGDGFAGFTAGGISGGDRGGGRFAMGGSGVEGAGAQRREGDF